ncbi:MAG TPA: hypothetical protein DHW82_13865 [Spirochaetia bacterium]|nr:MAG: hypothetical protein A2Y41_09755 [Spirochaetes bacterium GWB1_36_13]HCL58075.1 hypothetical protein [Spirochaetia bacterium]
MRDFEKQRNISLKDFSLDSMKKILILLGNPEKKLKFLHIAGTKGKTSISHYLADLLVLSGSKKVGLYTSPHLYHPEERIQISGKKISSSKLEELIEKIHAAALKNSLEITYFETLTAAAFLYFAESETDWVVLETGLGGRLDATNTVFPEASLITRIDKDHTRVLGKNLFKIAYEKLGILKKNTPFFLSEQKKSIALFARLYNFLFKKALYTPLPSFKIKSLNQFYLISNHSHQITFQGPYFGALNFSFALSVLLALEISLPFSFSYSHQVPGRFQIFPNGKGVIIFDGAHNPLAARKLIESIQKDYPEKKWIYLLNTFPDKDFKKMILILKTNALSFLVPEKEGFATENILSFLKEQKLSFQRIDPKTFSFSDNQNYCLTGSFYLFSDFKEKAEKPSKKPE